MKILSIPLLIIVLVLGVSSALADRLFVSINVQNSILEYDTAAGAGSQSLFASNIVGTSFLGLAIDAGGNVFGSVVNSSSGYGYIYKFTPAGSQSTWAVGLDPNCLLFDPSGNLFAPGFTYTGTKIIYEFTPGGTRSTFDTANGGTDGAFDRNTNLFIANGGYGNILKFTPADVVTVFASGFSSAYGVAFDTNGDLFMSDFVAGTIYKFSSSGGVLSSTPGVFAKGFNSPRGLAFDGNGNLFMADQNANRIYEFTNSSGILSSNATVFADLSASGYYPAYLAFGPTPVPTLFITPSNPNSVVVWWPEAGGYTLQTNNHLGSSSWMGYGGEVSTNNGTNSVTIAPAAGNLFFRLSDP